jgi:CDGSH-type Zn-finger protein
MSNKKPYIKITRNGPYMAFGISDISEKLILADKQGISVSYGDGKKFEIKSDPIYLCRCGHSKDAPFCDGSHEAYGFNGEETASFTPIHEQPSAEAFEGPDVALLDNQDYCAFARFCDAAGRIWNLVQEGGKAATTQAVKEANLCPAGRLIILDKKGNVLEDKLPQSIGVIEDTKLGISGPLWIRGGIRVESEDGKSYEIRMKQTLCRCGKSENKPFCNGAHAAARWKAGAE